MSSSAFISSLPALATNHRVNQRANLCSSFVSTSQISLKTSKKPCRSTIQMISPELARNAIAVYGVVIAGGGIGAFLKSGSKPSIISGVSAGIILAAAYLKDSVPIALGTAIALAVVFGIRLAKTKKFMPAGMLCIASVAAAVFFGVSIYG